MKKTYINPSMIVVKMIATTQMLAGSLGDGSTPTMKFGSAMTDDSEEGFYAD